MNYEFSLALLWLFLLALLSLKDFCVSLYRLFIAWRKRRSVRSFLPLLPLAFPLYLSMTLCWSLHPVRTILTVGILWCIYIVVYAICLVYERDDIIRHSVLQKTFLYSAASICFVCWLQCLLDVNGVPRSSTLLCRGCVSEMFGFPHPSGFAIEPQFMGNLLLAPLLYALYLSSSKTSKPSHFFLIFVFAATLFLTFSRGAIYSFALAYLFLVFFYLLQKKNTRFLRTLPVLIFSFLFTLAAQGVFAAMSPTADTFLSGIEKSISQLSLGRLELDLDKAPRDIPVPSPIAGTAASQIADEPSDSPSVFSGYVAESTDVRVGFNSTALQLAVSSPTQFLFGSGLGSAGTLMYERGKTGTKLEIIQNEYLSLLLETGLFGLLLAVSVSIYILYIAKQTFSTPERLLFMSVILAFALSLNFFSGLPNALHLYIFPVIIWLFLAKHKSIID